MLRVSGQSVHSWPDVQCGNALQLTWTLWPVYHWLQGHWQQPGIGELRPAQAKDRSVLSVASWFSPATRQGRECWQRGRTSHQSFWKQEEFAIGLCLGGTVGKFLHSFLFEKKGSLCLVGQIFFFFNLCLNHQTFRGGGSRCGWLRQ